MLVKYTFLVVEFYYFDSSYYIYIILELKVIENFLMPLIQFVFRFLNYMAQKNNLK